MKRDNIDEPLVKAGMQDKWHSAQKKEEEWWINLSCEQKNPERNRWDKLLSRWCGLLNIDSSAVVLDIGCGPDGLVCYFPEKGFKIGLDPLIDTYRKCYSLPNDLLLIKGCGENIPIKDASVDFIFCINALDHSLSPFSLLRDSWRVLKKGSFLLLDINTEPLLDRMFMKLGYKPPLDEYHPNKLFLPAMVSNLQEIGFEVIKEKMYLPLDIPELFREIIAKVEALHLIGQSQGAGSKQVSHNTPFIRHLFYGIIRLMDLLLYPFSRKYFSCGMQVLLRKN